MTPEDYNNLENILAGKDDEYLNPVESLIIMMSSPIAKRKGITISASECKIWIEELEAFLNYRQKKKSNNTSL